MKKVQKIIKSRTMTLFYLKINMARYKKMPLLPFIQAGVSIGTTQSNIHNNHSFPSLSESVANILVARNVAGIGIDTLSPDGRDSGFPVHKIILGADKYIVENIAGLEKMPAIGAYVLTLPIKGLGLTEAPVRMVGLINNGN